MVHVIETVMEEVRLLGLYIIDANPAKACIARVLFYFHSLLLPQLCKKLVICNLCQVYTTIGVRVRSFNMDGLESYTRILSDRISGCLFGWLILAIL